jgi:nicotinate-nucleotide adenylyltransferase
MAARDAGEQHGLDRIVFVPAARAPLKEGPQCLPVDRLAMVRSAIEGEARFELSDYEVARGGVSYTIDTARHFRRLHPADDLFWIIGGDQVARLERWRDIGELAGLLEFIAVERPGHEAAAPPAIPGLRIRLCRGHPVDASSTEVRERVRQGLPIDSLVPPKTVIYIREKGLYRGQG